MREKWTAWAVVVLAAGAAWGQAPEPAVRTVDVPVTPKVVLPVMARPTPLPAGVVAAADAAPPVSPSRQTARAPQRGWSEAIPAHGLDPADGGVVPASNFEPAAPSVAPHAKTASKFVPARRPGGVIKTVSLQTPPEQLPPPEPQPTPPPGMSTPPRLSLVPMGPGEAAPAPGGCPACGDTAAHAGKSGLHPLLAWFTYCPCRCCGHPCQPAPYIPHLYWFFLENCRQAHLRGEPPALH